MADFEVSLEYVVKKATSENGFSHNGVSFSLDDYFNDEVLNPDWIYFLARDIENKRNQMELSLEERYPVGTPRLYNALPESVKEGTNRPYLPHKAYFKLIDLIENNPKKYQGREGYIQLARDLRKNVKGSRFNAHLGNIWSATNKEIREKLKWEGKIDLPLKAFDKLKELIEDSFNPESERFERYQNDAGYITLAEDLRKNVKGFKAHLADIWSGTDEKTRKKLKWEGKIDLPLKAFDKLKELIEDSFNPESERFERYQNDAGYITLAEDLRENVKRFEAHLGNLWSATNKEIREKLKWERKINLPLKAFDTLKELIEDSFNPESERFERYHGDKGCIKLAEDLRDLSKGKFKANLGTIWSGTDKDTRKKLKWERKINLPLKAFDMLKKLIKDNYNSESERYQRYQNDAGYIKIAKDLRDLSKGKFKANLASIWSGTDEEIREQLNWKSRIELPLKVFDRLEELIRDNPERYRSDAGDLLLAEDLRKGEGGVDLPLRVIRAGAIDYIDDLGWTDKSLYGLKDRESTSFVKNREEARDGTILSGKNGRTSLVEDMTNEKYQNGQQNVNPNYAENVTDLKEAL